VDLTPNRADCLSMAGLAREVGVLNKAPVNKLEVKAVKASCNDQVAVDLVAQTACPRYLARVIKGVNVKAATPLWLKQRLERGGIRSIDPIVDITNYVLLELGQPM